MDPNFVIGYISTDEEVPGGKGKRKKKKPLTVATESFLTNKQRAKMKHKFLKKMEAAKRQKAKVSQN